MKKVFALWAALLGLVLAIVTHAPLHANLVMAPTSAGAPPTCTQGDTVTGRMSGLDTTHHNAMEAMVCGIVTDFTLTGNFTSTGCGGPFDAIYVFATNTTGNAILNICGTSLTAVLSTVNITFTADSGYTANTDVTNATQAIVDSTVQPSSFSGHYSQNSATIGTYTLNSFQDNTTDAGSIGSGAVNVTQIAMRNTSNNFSCDVNDNGPGVTASVATGVGFGLCTRNAASGAGAVTGYINGVSVGTATTASSGLANVSLGFAGFNAGSGFSSQATRGAAMAVIASGLNSGQALNLYNRFCTYLHTVNPSAVPSC